MSAPAKQPTVVLLWTAATPTLQYLPLPETGLVLGRDLFPYSADDRLSRQHAKITWDGSQFEITDLQSRNGTHLGASPLIHRAARAVPRAIVRTGRTVVALVVDAIPSARHEIRIEDKLVIGPSSAKAFDMVQFASTTREHVTIIGESGTGKTTFARRIAKQSGDATAMFDPSVQAIALERALGKATTLIVEQLGKLGDAHRAALRKLLAERKDVRVIATSTVPPLEASVPADLVQALGQITIPLRPLRERFDELGTILVEVIRNAMPNLEIHSTLLETALLRPWPGNITEFQLAMNRVCVTVSGQGKSHIRGEDLSSEAGQLMIGPPTIQTGAQQTVVSMLRKKFTMPPAGDE